MMQPEPRDCFPLQRLRVWDIREFYFASPPQSHPLADLELHESAGV